MPDRKAPMGGWPRNWTSTGRWRTRPGLFGWMVIEHEEWRYHAGDDSVAPEFRWRRGRPGWRSLPTDVEAEVAYREQHWPVERAPVDPDAPPAQWGGRKGG